MSPKYHDLIISNGEYIKKTNEFEQVNMVYVSLQQAF